MTVDSRLLALTLCPRLSGSRRVPGSSPLPPRDETRGIGTESTPGSRFAQPAAKESLMLRSIIVGTAVCIGVAAAAAAQDAKAKGEKIYADQKCSLCHSIGDKGNKKGPLDEAGSKLSADEIRQWIVDAKGMTAKTKAPRKPEMKSYTLPKEDVDALVAYLGSLKKK
jgi:mono/diheme cytochrome c family protein